MTEWLDIVDIDDRVIGRDTRPNIHANGAWHRSSHVVLYNSGGQLFVQLRSMSKDSGGGLWDTSAAGHVDSGESYDQCAIRELHEELGIRIDMFRRWSDIASYTRKSATDSNSPVYIVCARISRWCFSLRKSTTVSGFCPPNWISGLTAGQKSSPRFSGKSGNRLTVRGREIINYAFRLDRSLSGKA